MTTIVVPIMRQHFCELKKTVYLINAGLLNVGNIIIMLFRLHDHGHIDSFRQVLALILTNNVCIHLSVS